MSSGFLSNIMHTVLEATEADRAIVFDMELNGVDAVQLEAQEILAAYREHLQKMLSADEVLIADNYSLNEKAADALVSTNQFVPTLRSLVLFPVRGLGVIYIDKLVRRGVIQKNTVENLFRVINGVVEKQQLDLSQDELSALYQETQQ